MTSEKRLSNLEFVGRVDRYILQYQCPFKISDLELQLAILFMRCRGVQEAHDEILLLHDRGFEKPFGYAHSDIIKEMTWSNVWCVDHEKRILKLLSPDDFQQRTSLVHDTLRSGHNSGKVEALRHWNKETFAVYDSDGQHVMDMVASGLPLFGVIVFGVHMTGYTKTEESLKYWVPRRSKTKIGYPGKLDNTVGGSLASGKKAIDCMVRESNEEASLSEDYTRANVKPCGALSY